MKKPENKFRYILYIFIMLITSNVIHAKSLDKLYKSDRISNYFSAVLSLEDGDYVKSYKYFKQLKGLEESHFPYSQTYHYSLISLEKFNEAYDFAKNLEDKNLDSFETNLFIGIYSLKNNKLDVAKKYFKNLNQTNNKNPIQDLISITLNNWIVFPNIKEKEAINTIENLPDRFTSIKKIQNSFAHCFFDSKNTDIAFQKLTENNRLDFSRYGFFYVNYLYLDKQNKRSLDVINKLIEPFPNNLILSQLKENISNNNPKDFTNKFDCKKLTNIFSEIFYIAANSLSQQRLYTLSNYYLNIAKYLNNDFKSFDILYAENFINLNKYDEALKIYNKNLNIGSVYSWYITKQISRILKEKKRDKEAINFITKNFEKIKNPNVKQTFDYANFLKNNKNFEKAIKFYSQALRLINKNHYLYPDIKEGRGTAYEQSGLWDMAEKDLMDSLESSPDQAYVINYLAYSWIEKGKNIEKSLKMLERANSLKKNDGFIIDSLGWALFKLKKYDQAKTYLQKAIKLMPTDPVVNDHFGDVLWKTNNSLEARYYWKNALKLKNIKKELKEKIEKKIIYGYEVKL